MAETVTMQGGEAIAEMLRRHEVGVMFGMGGFQLLPYYDAVRRLGLTHVLVNDERSGVFAADAQARITNRPGVCDATLGPGATNLVTGLVESLNAGTPLIALVGDTHRAYSGKNMTQETHQLEVLRPASKAVIRIERGERIPELVRRAYGISTSGRPGPVVIAVPEDVAHGEFTYQPSDLWVDLTVGTVPARRIRPDSRAVADAAVLLRDAQRPIVLVGGGVHLSDAYTALERFVAANSLPVAHTLSGKGALACTDPLSVGLFGRYSRFANELIHRSDCLLVVGCKLGEIATNRYTVPTNRAPLIHMDIVPEEIGHWAQTAVGLWCDAASGLNDLYEAMGVDNSSGLPDRASYLSEIESRRRDWASGAASPLASSDRPIGMPRLIAALNATLPASAVVVADGGFASHWAGLLYDVKRPGRGFVADRGFASIGYGLPGCLGVWSARPAGPIVGLTGDGGMNMSLGELETARRAGAAFTLIVVNNSASGYVKALQHSVFGPGSYQSSDLSELNYARLAVEFGCHGIRVDDPRQLEPALRKAIAASDVPTVVDVAVTRDPGQMLPGIDSRTVAGTSIADAPRAGGAS